MMYRDQRIVYVVIQTILLHFFIKRCHVVPEVGFTAANAGMTGLDGKTCCVVKFRGGTIIIGFRAFTAQFIQTISKFGFLGAEFLDEFIIFIMFEAGTVVMNGFPVSKGGSAVVIKFNFFRCQGT